ncbi:MAG: hypothetical protein M3132_05890 [Actinomycetia bacterium]|nr:hypothetical protein [Actinomycetes bacterium]
MKKILASMAAAGVLVAGAFVATSVTPTAAEAQTADDTATSQTQRPERGAILDDVLGNLVADGTIDQSQADAVKEALEAKRDELKEQFGDRGPRMDQRRGFLRGLLADDVITADEIAALPEDHPLRTGESPLSELLEDDGEITRAELESFRDARHAERETESSGTVG